MEIMSRKKENPRYERNLHMLRLSLTAYMTHGSQMMANTYPSGTESHSALYEV